ncbi:MAG: hypothetical protein BJ554DRAFT_5606 [Olpidium bornovanus]|uniref:B9 domain-containing protein 2 n=1 Tax=Olpidium bornovanus TaxID=278681 RepID=A0A8H8DKP9_9FUNG|nr:MAG: hypothetical protein BJ554DRAFT_5606 [Olpidium bornovanus]
MAEVHVIGTIRGASGFPSPNLCCRWSVVAGEEWQLLEGHESGQTQVDLPQVAGGGGGAARGAGRGVFVAPACFRTAARLRSRGTELEKPARVTYHHHLFIYFVAARPARFRPRRSRTIGSRRGATLSDGAGLAEAPLHGVPPGRVRQERAV